jgi:hypothetical protein
MDLQRLLPWALTDWSMVVQSSNQHNLVLDGGDEDGISQRLLAETTLSSLVVEGITWEEVFDLQIGILTFL